MDKETNALLRKDNDKEFERAKKEIKPFSLSTFKNYENIENALSEYVFVMALNEIYRKSKETRNQFFFGRIASGLMIENIVEAIIRTRLERSRKGYTLKFIDTQGVDFEIRKDNEVVAEIQCKAEIDEGKGQLGHETLLKKASTREKTENATFAFFWGYLWFSKGKFPSTRERKRRKEEILREFSQKEMPVFLVFKDQDHYSLDKNSIFMFIKLIEKILSN
jgi:hypothetical protein